MDNLVNNLEFIQRRIVGSGVTVALVGERIKVTGPGGTTWLRVKRLSRPWSSEVVKAAAPDTFLVLVGATAKAAEAAAPYNHTVLPDGSFHLISPGVSLLREALTPPASQRKTVRLTGRTGVVAEVLLLARERPWSVHDLARASLVSPGLAHRILARLEAEGVVESSGLGPTKARRLVNAAALAEMWSQEEQTPIPFLRGYLYGASPEIIAQRVLLMCPAGAIGGVLAANLHKPTLTRVPYPIRIWVPEQLGISQLREAGLEETVEGANLELVRAKQNPWRVNVDTTQIAKVSTWRAWVEMANASGRTKELADALISQLQGTGTWI